MCDSSSSYNNKNENTTKPECVVKTENGAIRGYVDSSDNGTFYKFKRVPYAEPPLGHLRFMPPSPISSWTGEIDCTQDTPMPMSLNSTQLCSEDCLYVEISSPDITPSKSLPVMFWIGCVNYSYCFDEIHDPTALNSSGVVFVRCGFRIGPFGFLSIKDVAAPGNCGLKDIVMALKWVQKNIKHFGGDPNNITLFGSNSGGSLAHLMILSPSASGLFHKAIIQSACAMNNWSLTLNPLKAAAELAQQVGITKTDKHEIIEELKSLPTQTIMKAFYELCLKTHDTDCVDGIFKPCIEEEFEGQQAFLPKSPINLLKSGVFNKVPMIIGSNNIEGTMIAHLTSDFYKTLKAVNFNVNSLKPFSEESKSIRTLSRQKLLQFILGENEHSSEANHHQYMQMVSDFYYLYHINKTVRLHSEYAPDSPIFYYIFNCYVEYGGIKDTNFLTGYSAELRFLFPTKYHGTPEINGDSLTSNRMIKMWTNFAKYGNPTPQEDSLFQVTWSPVENKERLNYLNIGYDLTIGRNPFHDRMKFWDEVHDNSDILKFIIYFNEMGILW